MNKNDAEHIDNYAGFDIYEYCSNWYYGVSPNGKTTKLFETKSELLDAINNYILG